MWIASLAALAAQCSGADLNEPYILMQDGFLARSPERVAEAYHDEAVIGGQTTTRVVRRDALPDLFGYVRPPNGETLTIEFRIISRSVAEELAADRGFYQITGSDGSNFGEFTTVLNCGDEGVWRFSADFMGPAEEDDWLAAQCVAEGLCD